MKLPVTPVRSPSRPVMSDAREGVHTDAPACRSEKRMPRARSASRCGVSSVSGLLKP